MASMSRGLEPRMSTVPPTIKPEEEFIQGTIDEPTPKAPHLSLCSGALFKEYTSSSKDCEVMPNGDQAVGSAACAGSTIGPLPSSAWARKVEDTPAVLVHISEPFADKQAGPQAEREDATSTVRFTPSTASLPPSVGDQKADDERSKTPEPVDDAVLTERALAKRMQTACSILVAASDGQPPSYEFRSVWSTKPSDLGDYGVGIQLYFDFLRFLGFVFLAMSVITLPSMIIASMGSLVDNDQYAADSPTFYRIMGMVSIANLGHCPDCKRREEYRDRLLHEGSSTKLIQVVPWIAVGDVLSIVIFAGFAIWFRLVWIPQSISQQDEAHITPADFAVQVKGLPRNLGDNHGRYEELLGQHFKRILGMLGVNDPEPVSEVCLIREYDGAIKSFMRQGNLLKRRRNAEVGQLLANRAGKMEEVERFSKEIKDLSMRIDRIELDMREQGCMVDETRDVCMAFISFGHEEYKMKVLHLYRWSTWFWPRVLQSKLLRFGRKRLILRQACEPNNLFWENLDFHHLKHLGRWLLSICLSLAVLAASLLVLSFFRSIVYLDDSSMMESQAAWVIMATGSHSPCVSPCGIELCADQTCKKRLPNVSGFGESRKLVSDVGSACWNSSRCSSDDGSGAVQNSRWIALTPPKQQLVRRIRFLEPPGMREFGLYSCDSGTTELLLKNSSSSGSLEKPAEGCTRWENIETHGDESEVPVYPDDACRFDVAIEAARRAQQEGKGFRDSRLRCFCVQQGREKGFTFRFAPYDTEEAKLCEDWSGAENAKVALLAGGILAVLMINQVLLLQFEYLAQWVRYPTATNLQESQMLSCFGTQLVNTGIIVLLISLNLAGISGHSVAQTMQLGQGRFHDVGVSWYVAVGSSFIITVVGQGLSELSLPWAWARIVEPLMVRWFRRGVYTQEMMDDVYMLPEWSMALRLAGSMTLVFCVVMYSAGIPLLNLVAAAYCFGAYWLDKWCLLRHSRKPPALTEDVIESALGLFLTGACLHLGIALWMYGEQDVFPSAWGGLVGALEPLLGITRERYEEVMRLYRTATAVEKEDLWWDYVRARFLDVGRESCLPHLLFVIGYIAVLVLGILWRVLGKAVCGPLRHFIFGTSRPRCDSGGIAEQHFEAAAMKARQSGTVFSYKLNANPRYKDAYEALSYDPGDENAYASSSHYGKRFVTLTQKVLHSADVLSSKAENCWTRVEDRLLDCAEAVSEKAMKCLGLENRFAASGSGGKLEPAA